ncbi:MAG: PAS domain-containing protein [Candidatus Thorarchaeota archaeon]|nr:PAS domain-containing protein [Candidatus Thorarchaeota archaeon]
MAGAGGIIANPEWESIFQAIGHPTIILDKNHRILMVNTATVQMLRKSNEELVGKLCHEVFHDTDEPACGCPLEAMLSSGTLETNEMVIEALGGTYLVSCTPVMDKDGNLERIIHIATDISARFRAEEALEAVLDIMAHDLRNRLQAALLGAELLGDTCRGLDSVEAVDAILESVGSLGTIIEKVQSTRGFLNEPLGIVVLEDVLMQAVKILRYRHPDAKVNLSIETQNAIVMADTYLENLILNILENGVIHNTSKTKILWVSLVQIEHGYNVTIGDNGPGIPDHLIGSLFDSERRFGGVGIHQSARLAKKYGGRIKLNRRVKEDVSQGSQFTICLPSH